jgi:hypothetical protein
MTYVPAAGTLGATSSWLSVTARTEGFDYFSFVVPAAGNVYSM